MKKNAHGFTVIETTIVLLIACLIGFAGWYVFDQQSSKKESTAKSNATSQLNSKQKNNKTFSHAELSFAFQYPADWTTVDNTTDYGFYSVRLRAPGTVIESCQGECLKSGAQILLLRNPVRMHGSVMIDNLERFKASSVEASNLRNTKTIQVDGVKMLEYDNDATAEGGTSLHGVQFFKNDVDYSITLDNAQYSQKQYGSVFDSIVRSIRFN